MRVKLFVVFIIITCITAGEKAGERENGPEIGIIGEGEEGVVEWEGKNKKG